MNIPPKLKEYLDNAREPLPPISDPDELLHVDSLALMRLLAFMENEMGIQVEEEEIHADNFMSLRTLGELIAPKLQTGESS